MDMDAPETTGTDTRRRVARMAPEARREQLVDMAADFFSEHGFDAGTRQLADRLGVTQPLIYRYFASKDELINEVYRRVYVGQWQDAWTAGLRDRSRPMRDRLTDFYRSYAPAIFNRRWMRIFFFAGLKGLDINQRYIGRVADLILIPIAEEMRAELGIDSHAPISEHERELVWLMHGAVFYQGIREHIYRSIDHVDYDFALRMAVGLYMERAPELIWAAVTRDGAPISRA
jgi:AcrR family transcriptional regulator